MFHLLNMNTTLRTLYLGSRVGIASLVPSLGNALGVVGKKQWYSASTVSLMMLGRLTTPFEFQSKSMLQPVFDLIENILVT